MRLGCGERGCQPARRLNDPRSELRNAMDANLEPAATVPVFLHGCRTGLRCSDPSDTGSAALALCGPVEAMDPFTNSTRPRSPDFSAAARTQQRTDIRPEPRQSGL